MAADKEHVLKTFRLWKVLIPVIIGISVTGYLVYSRFDRQAFLNIDWGIQSLYCLLVAILLMVVRDVAYMYRIRLLTDRELSWKRSFQVIMLWEFASSVTPTIVGGSAVALYIVSKEKIPVGKSTAIVLVTAMLDELFYILMVPLVILLASTEKLFSVGGNFVLFNTQFGLTGIFLIGYTFILFMTLIIIFGVFFRPRGLKFIILNIFRLSFLRKWRVKAAEAGNDIITTSKEMRSRPLIFWIKAYLATLFSWTARFWVVNFLIMTVNPVHEHFLIYARQLIMWVILLITPTPGGSGVAEFAFSDFLGEFITPGLEAAFALLWRLISYYPYIFIGIIVLPVWVKRVFSKN